MERARLLAQLEAAVEQVVAANEIGVARSLRMHVGGPAFEPATTDRLLALGDRLFACPRVRWAQSGGATICLWEHGQIATVSAAPALRDVMVVTVLGSGGALHLREQAP